MTDKPHSLRRRLLVLISLPVILGGLAIGGMAVGFTYHEIGEVYDAQLVESAKLLYQLTVHELQEPDEEGLVLGQETPDIYHSYEKETSFRIWKDSRLVTESVTTGVFGPKPSRPGFSLQDVDGDGTYWRIFVYEDKRSGITIEVAQNNKIRRELILQILGSLFFPALVFVPMIMFFVWRGATASLKPMLALARQVDARSAEDLTPLETGNVPQEIMPFVGGLNRLFRRVDETLQREREFTDNAAHELRTPLAAMKTQAQVLTKKAGNLPDCRDGLDNLLASIDRAARLVEQLLAFARLQNASQVAETVDFSALAEETLREISPAALARGQALEAAVTPGVSINGYAGALAILIRNLADNAIKYTPNGGHIRVALAREGGKILLSVSDDGPGIPEEHKARIFDRFYRVNKSHGTGSGLGLAMVRWIADMHRAEIALENLAPRGLRVRVVFPETN